MNGNRPRWLDNWLQRHQSPLSIVLHLIGIPVVVVGVVLALLQMIGGDWHLWWRPVGLIFVGYVLQIIGHWHEGNDAGEWIVIKRMLGMPYVAVAPRYRREKAAARRRERAELQREGQ